MKVRVYILVLVFSLYVFGHEGHEHYDDPLSSGIISSVINKHWNRFATENQHLVKRGANTEDAVIDLSYKCMHAEIVNQTKPVFLPDEEAYGSKRQTNGTLGPIRFLVNTDLLVANADVGYTCYNAGDTVTLANGSSKACTANHVLTPALSTFLSTNVVPAIIETFNVILQAVQLSSITLLSGKCQGAPIPTSYTNGISGYDYIVFVTGRPSPDDQVVASAGFCQALNSGRPVAGTINFGPYKFQSFVTGNTINQFQFAGAVKVGVHEMTHALGFTPQLYSKYNPGAQINRLVNGTSPSGNTYSTPIEYLTGPSILAKAGDYYGCNTLDSVPLEDGGGAGTALAHWEQRIAGDEYMVGYISSSMPVSVLTMALFEDMGWYKANYSAAEYWGWGKGQGCGFVTNRCESVWPNSQDYWCTATTTSAKCTPDRRAKGVCTVTSWNGLPAYYQHFSNPSLGGNNAAMDYCPTTTAYSNRYCEDYNQFEAGNDVYTHGSRCWYLGTSSANAANGVATCLRHNCSSETVLKVEYGGQWISCPSAGGAVQVGNNAYVNCPPASLFCKGVALENIAALPFPTGQGLTSATKSLTGGGLLTLPDLFGAADRNVCFVVLNLALVLLAIM